MRLASDERFDLLAARLTSIDKGAVGYESAFDKGSDADRAVVPASVAAKVAFLLGLIVLVLRGGVILALAEPERLSAEVNWTSEEDLAADVVEFLICRTSGEDFNARSDGALDEAGIFLVGGWASNGGFDLRLSLASDEDFDARSDGASDEAFDAGSAGASDEAFDAGSDDASDEDFDAGLYGTSDEDFDARSDDASDEDFDAGVVSASDEDFDVRSDNASDEDFDAGVVGASDEDFDSGTDSSSDEDCDTKSGVRS